MARPKTIIDWVKVNKYLQAQCDGTGIAGLLGISADTLYRACQEDHKMGFAEYSAQKKGEGKELLRAKQFSIAMEGDKTMLVWLGKQYLNQKDRNELTGNDGKDLIPTIIFKNFSDD
jgi:hypothetical protein